VYTLIVKGRDANENRTTNRNENTMPNIDLTTLPTVRVKTTIVGNLIVRYNLILTNGIIERVQITQIDGQILQPSESAQHNLLLQVLQDEILSWNP